MAQNRNRMFTSPYCNADLVSNLRGIEAQYHEMNEWEDERSGSLARPEMDTTFHLFGLCHREEREREREREMAVLTVPRMIPLNRRPMQQLALQRGPSCYSIIHIQKERKQYSMVPWTK